MEKDTKMTKQWKKMFNKTHNMNKDIQKMTRDSEWPTLTQKIQKGPKVMKNKKNQTTT